MNFVSDTEFKRRGGFHGIRADGQQYRATSQGQKVEDRKKREKK